MSGYWGKVLNVDLTEGKTSVSPLPEEWRRAYIGGTGFAAKVLHDEVPAGADALGPDNVFIFGVGPFQGGSRVLGSGRFAACAKSPLTGIFGESLGGGYNAEEFKKAGFDGLVVKGKSSKPVYLWVHDGQAELRDASHLWGKTDAYETEDALKKELGDKKIQVAPIGPAAENLVRYAGLICNYGHGCAGRTGMGAVMGSKNLKAIAFRGTQTVPIARPEELDKLKKEFLAIAKDADFTKANRELGQAMAVVPREENGLLPMKNFMQDRWPEGARKLGAGEGQDYNPVLKPRQDACSNCIMGCHRRVTVSEGKYAMDSYGPEYETLAMIGSSCLIDNLLAVNKANELCNRYGLDTIEFGGVCAFAMEAYEAGQITKNDLGGIELRWGDGDAMLALLEKIAKREGDVPWLLGEGVRPAGEKLGVSDPLHVNGAVVPAHDPRAFLSMAVETATSMKGASHLHGFPEAIELGVTFPETGHKELTEPLDPHSPTHKGLAAVKFQDRMACCNSMVFCFFYEFSGLDFTRQTNFLNAIAGWDLTPQDLLKSGERIVNLMHMFNLKQGLEPLRDYRLPRRFMTPHAEGGAASVNMPFDDMVNEYYSVRDWPKGVPSRDKLKELGLEFCL
ncbi:MAG: aldehyde ferredoxin oxidoreductase [Proteobacteria bacterium]|nr:aldehyde ferredoxin oxidoreductase [Pseudomonadota bacterium]